LVKELECHLKITKAESRVVVSLFQERIPLKPKYRLDNVLNNNEGEIAEKEHGG
jgi:hypothetical protein